MARRTLTKLVPLLLIVTMQAAQAFGTQQGSGSGQVHGVVFDPQGAGFPKVGVIITLIDRNLEYSARTNAKGVYDFTNLPPGSWRVLLQAPPTPLPFKRVVISSVEVTGGKTTDLESHMPVSDVWDPVEKPDGSIPEPASGDIEGLVWDDNKAIIPEAEVTLLEPDTGVSHRTTTDSWGRYRFIDLRPGKYEVRLYKTRLVQNRVFVSVAAGKIARPKTRLKTAKPYTY